MSTRLTCYSWIQPCLCSNWSSTRSPSTYLTDSSGPKHGGCHQTFVIVDGSARGCSLRKITWACRWDAIYRRKNPSFIIFVHGKKPKTTDLGQLNASDWSGRCCRCFRTTVLRSRFARPKEENGFNTTALLNIESHKALNRNTGREPNAAVSYKR